MLNELISREDCANCKICCKFEPDELIDAPVFNKDQMEYIKNNINSEIKFNEKNGLYQIELIKYKNKYKCPLLTDKGCLLPNEYRPFDCESWPFYVMRNDKEFLITKSNDCPVFNKVNDDVLIDYIKREFLEIAKDIATNYPELVTEYNRNLKILYTFNLDDEKNN